MKTAVSSESNMLDTLTTFISYILIANGLFDIFLVFSKRAREFAVKSCFGRVTEDSPHILMLHGMIRLSSGMYENNYGRNLAIASYLIESFYASKGYLSGKTKFLNSAPCFLGLPILALTIYLSESSELST